MKALIVDDDPVARFLLINALKKVDKNLQILTASNGQEALYMLKEVCSRENCPDLILLDTIMPNMGGFEFLDIIHVSELVNLPFKIILLTSSYNNSEELKKANQYPIDAYLTKPLTRQEAKAIITSNLLTP